MPPLPEEFVPMRKQERIVCISVFLVVVYTSVIVGIAEESLLPYALTLPITAATLAIALKRPTWQLASLPANILGLLAFALAGAELLMGSIEARLLSGAHLMTYLTWIVLWQKKQMTQYWWLFALSVIQVAIGSILMSTVLYGLFLFGFLLISVWTLAIFSLYRSQMQFAPADENDARTQGFSKIPGFCAPESPAAQFSRAIGTVQFEAGRWVSARFIGGLLGITLASTVVGFTFFLLVPRQWIGEVAWGADHSRSGALVGFGDSVKLGSFGTLLESRERVMEVRLFDQDDRPLEVEAYAGALGFDSPLFRGSVLESYEDGQWTKSSGRPRFSPLQRRQPRDSIRQEFRLKPVGSKILFVMQQNPLQPMLGGDVDLDDPTIFADPIEGMLRHGNKRRSIGMIEYEVFSAPASAGKMPIPVSTNLRYLRLDAALQAALKEIAEREIGVAAGDPPEVKARKIVAFLRDSGKFTYSLKIARRQHLELDPVLEFLQHRRSGHCEYFATALGLLLRSVKIPSRLVWGFKGGSQNELSDYFEVEQRHAHVWVEAGINGQWVTLDATPAARSELIDQGTGLMHSWLTVTSYFKSLWSRFVIGISLADQNRSFYTPLQSTALDAWNSVSQERKKSASGLQALLEFLSNPSRWFSWQGGLLSLVLMLMLATLSWTARKVVSLIRNLSGDLAAAHRQRIQIAFYERFRRLCEAYGLVRQPAQTQREFADEVSGRFSPLLQPAGLAALPLRLATAFYDVRFGARELNDGELREIDGMLTDFERRLPARNGAAGSK
jgi:protein-glutamine gamma-glutamyltransferase